MALVSASDLSISFPIYGFLGDWSLKKTILDVGTFGTLGKDHNKRDVVHALDGVSFDLFEGDRVGLLGKNGAGKSTLLQAIAGVYEPTSGRIDVNGRVSSLLSISYGMDFELSGLDNIFIRGAMMGVKKSEMESRIGDIADFSELGDYLRLPVRAYSSGMIMRLAFSIATSCCNEVVLMDEWLSTGDATFVDKATSRLNKLVDESRLSVIASHNEGLLRDKCNVIMTLDRGKLLSLERF